MDIQAHVAPLYLSGVRPQKQYRTSGVSSVPTYIINGEYMINGAQSPEDFTNLFKKISPTFKSILPEGKTCDDDICEIN